MFWLGECFSAYVEFVLEMEKLITLPHKARIECLDLFLWRGMWHYLHQLLGNSVVRFLLRNIFQSIHIWKYNLLKCNIS